MPIAIVVHGGAGQKPEGPLEVFQDGCRQAAMAGWRILQEGGSALDAVEAAVRSLEDNPTYNAGTGASLNADGNIQLDAGIMEGHTLQVGSVAGVELIKHPITLARSVLQSPHVLLIGQGAQQFALEQGFALTTLEDLITERQYNKWKKAQLVQQEPGPGQRHGTVGAVALDSSSKLAAATSTGGMFNKHPGRVGDSPLVGAGFYADEQSAISCTGDGEDFTRRLIAKRAAEEVARGASAQQAAEAAIAVLCTKSTGLGGLIIVDHAGHVGIARNSRNMARAYLCGDMLEPEAGV